MLPSAPSVRPLASRGNPVLLRRMSLATVACWTLAGAVLSAAAFHAWTEPFPNPATDGPLPTDSVLSFYLGGAAMAALFSCLSVPMALTGSAYLRRIQLAGRWSVAWAAAIAVEVLFVGLFTSAIWPGLVWPHHGEWVLLVMTGLFIASGIAMATIIRAASQAARRA